MSELPYNFKVGHFAEPGSIGVSSEAMRLAASFIEALGSASGASRWVATFAWLDERKYREGPDAEWVDE